MAMTVETRNGKYLDVDGVRTYCEVHGDGPPLFLLHGGLCTAETWDSQISALADRYRVYVPERYAHGRTADVDGPITYENMAEHTIAVIEAFGLESVSLVGWSDGALVALLVALRRPKLVTKLVLIDQFVSLADAPAGYLDFMNAMTEDTAPPPMVEAYRALAPEGAEHFPVVFSKLHKLWTDPTGVELDDLRHVTAPTLLLVGEEGAVTLAHAAAMRDVLADSQVAVVPGTSHGLMMEKPHVVNQLILDFLADEQVAKLFSLDH